MAEPLPSAEPLLHIGFHKTASTFLQNELFGDAAAGFASPPAPRHRIVRDVVVPDPLAYDAAAVRGRYAPFMREAAEAGLVPVVSHERLSGYPSAGGRDRVEVAGRLAQTFPGARVLVVVREQRALIRSWYAQHVSDGGVEGVERFLKTPEPQLNRKPAFAFAFYEFDRLVAHYQALFGRERVLVLPFETLRADPAAFLSRVATFCGQPAVAEAGARRVNAARPLLMQAAQRPLNFLFYHNELSPGALAHIPRFHKRYARLLPVWRALSPAPLERRLDARLRARIDRVVGDRYAASNARLQGLTGEPLGALGYATAARPLADALPTLVEPMASAA